MKNPVEAPAAPRARRAPQSQTHVPCIHKSPSGSSSSKKSSKLPSKVLAGISVGVIAAVGAVVAGILYCCGCFKKKKKTGEGVAAPQQEVPPPPVYGGEMQKGAEPQVQPVYR